MAQDSASSAWYSGADRTPTTLIPHHVSIGGAVREVLDGVCSGQRVEAEQLAILFAARGREVPAIAELADELKAKYGGQDYFRETCGLPISTYFSAVKLLWLMRNVPAVAEAIANGKAMFGPIDTWLIWNLSGGRIVSRVES